MKYNFRVFARYLTSSENDLVDALSRGQMERFFRLAPMYVNKILKPIPEELWPLSKIWVH